MADVFLLAGPTASGKSALALQLADALDADIVNADAMQVYADLRVLTARPSAAEMAGVPHHLYGHVDGSERYSVGRWLEDALPVIERIRGCGRRALLVGGTGLYFEALTEGLATIPPIGEETRRAVREDCPSGDALYEAARAADPDAAARVDPADAQRLWRIVEVWRETGRTLTAWRADTRPALSAQDWRGLALIPERATLYARIDARAAAMLEQGAWAEVEALAARGLAADLPVMKALGAPQLLGALEGRWSAEEALALLQRDSRRYAKRQLTWLRGRMAGWPQMRTPDAAAGLAAWGVPV